ncbi:MAG: glycosyltransferase, partial [Solirubrobacterales bacterium]
MSRTDPSVRVVVPTYDEADNIEPLTASLLDVLPRGAGITIVDDNSPDGTGAIADRLAQMHPVVDVLHR